MQKTYIYILVVLMYLAGNRAMAQFVKIHDFQKSNDLTSPYYSQSVFDGTYLYGMTCYGGANNLGGIYRVKTDGTGYEKLLDFSGTPNGSNPLGSLTLSGTVLYGMASLGGANSLGCIFSINTDGTGYTKLFDFSGAADGANPKGALTISGTVMYGMTYAGGTNNYGCIFSINTDGTGYTKLLDFTGTVGAANGSDPVGSLILSGAVLYGMTYHGGTSNYGCIFKINTDGTGYTKLLNFTGAANGKYPQGSLTISGTVLYGMTLNGGTSDYGCIFKINTDGTGYTKMLNFSGVANGRWPYGNLFLSGTVLYGMTSIGGTNGFGCIFMINTDGTGFSKLLDFSGVATGNSAFGSLILSGSVLYGVTLGGGINSLGCVFKINTDGTGFSKIMDFSDISNGSTPNSSLVLSGTVLYGVTYLGGSNNYGCIFKINTDGTGYTKLLDFSGSANGSYPWGALTLSGTVLYGMTVNGGTSDLGSIYKINTDGTGYAKLLDFTGAANGSNPRGSLTLSGSVLYGMTSLGGASSLGCIFKINTDGTGYTRLFDFTGAANGSTPWGSLTLSGTVLYGMTCIGGASALGCIFKINTDGTGYTKLLDFTGAANGSNPYGSLALSGSVLYGMTSIGGTSALGCIFKINTDGTGYSKLLDFTGAANGSTPKCDLTVSGLSGTVLYGMTSLGGTNSKGCLFKINTDGTGYSKELDFSGTADGQTPNGSITLSGTSLYGMTSIGGTSSIGVIFKQTDVELPIELISFNAKYNNKKVHIAWVTATETNNDYFAVERSQDAKKFKPVATLKGAGTSAHKLSYSLADNEPYEGISYYRLRQTDFDGMYTYSQIIAVIAKNNASIDFSVYPNPLNTIYGNDLSVNLSGLEKDSSVLVVLLDVLGKEYYSKILRTDINGSIRVTIENKNISLPKGVYIVRAASNNKLFSEMIMVE